MERLGPYELVREIARGGMGVVYEARHPELPRRLAIKQILPGEATPEVLLRFQREAEALARLRHPNVVPVHELGQTERGPYLVSALVPGETLDAALARGPLPPRRAAELVAALSDAVAAVHAAGVLHRDLKPSNVMLTPAGEPVLLDFGLARDLKADRLTRTGELLGTPAYMAPEQALGGAVDARTDVYGLGGLLFACLAGSAPFGGTLVQCLHDVVETEPPWPRAPAPLRAVLRRAMAKAPEARYATPGELRVDLERFLAGEAVAAPLGGRAPTAVAVAAVVVVAALGVVLSRGAAPEPGRAADTPAPAPTRAAAGPSGATAPVGSLRALERRLTGKLPAGPKRILAYEQVLELPRSPERARWLGMLREQRLAVWRLERVGQVQAVCWGPFVAARVAREVHFHDLARPKLRPPRRRWETVQVLGIARGRGREVVIALHGEVLFWDGSGQQRVHKFTLGRGPLKADARIMDLARDRSGERVAAVGQFRDAMVLDLRTQRVVRWVTVNPDWLVSLRAALRGDRLAVSGWSKLLGRVRIASVETGELSEAVALPTRISSLAFVDERRLLIGGQNGSIRVWDGVASPRAVQHPELTAREGKRPAVLALRRSGRYVIALSCDANVGDRGSELQVFDAERLVPRWARPRRLKVVSRSLDVSDDGRFMAIGTPDGSVELWATPVD